jgi:hypothetical protein
MKDYFDLWLLTRQPELNSKVLATAIKRTKRVPSIPKSLCKATGSSGRAGELFDFMQPVQRCTEV